MIDLEDAAAFQPPDPSIPARSDIPGWSLPGEFERLAEYASECEGPWVEIGSYCGRSTVFLGTAAKMKGITVFACDPHRGNPEMAVGEDCYHQDVWEREHGSLSVLIDTIRDNGLESVVVPVVGPGAALAATRVRPGFVFIDGDHSYQGAKADVDAWTELLLPGGILAMHDSTNGGPCAARQDAIHAGWELVEVVGCLSILNHP
jgi:predicted O-methyltransferase YrrM